VGPKCVENRKRQSSRLVALSSDEFGFAEHNEPTEGFAFLPVESGALDFLILRPPVSSKRNKKKTLSCAFNFIVVQAQLKKYSFKKINNFY
jgi:hypothetical protein